MIFALGFWVIRESNVRVLIKMGAIVMFFAFCVALATSLDTSLGWASDGKHMAKTVIIRHVAIKEPNPQTLSGGGIFILIEQPATRYQSIWLDLFGYETESAEPRLYRLPYSRNLHEQLQAKVMPRLQAGQMVQGTFEKGKGKGKGQGKAKGSGDGTGNATDGARGSRRGYDGQSLEADWQFHVLVPSLANPK